MWLEEEVDVMLYPMGKSKHIFKNVWSIRESILLYFSSVLSTR